MPNLVAERPVTQPEHVKSSTTGSHKKVVQAKKKKLPPGQKLLICGGLIGAVVAASFSINQLNHRVVAAPKTVEAVAEVVPPIALKYPLEELRNKIGIAADMKDLRTGAFAFDPDTGKFVDFNGRDAYSAASMIKVPVFVALLQAVDEKKISLDQMVEVRQDLITGGSGWLQWRPVGTKMALRDVAELMIVISDNTATNICIDLLGGKEACNESFVKWGLEKTRINNMLGDFEGTNKTSPYDLVYLLARIDRGELLFPDTKKFMIKTMERTHIRTLLNPGLAPGSKIAHKTGDIGTMVGDAGIVTTPEGKHYIVSVQVERPHNDRRANLLIRALSKMIYKCFSSVSLTCDDVQVQPLESLAPPRHRGHGAAAPGTTHTSVASTTHKRRHHKH